jgi:predicted NAD/FAD-dependent oxidoreductase
MMNTTGKTTQCVIVGGGISGLTAATILQKHEIQVTILDKGRGIGGRLATRRLEASGVGVGVFDYGAQYCTAQTPIFQEVIGTWENHHVTKIWSHGFRTANGRLKQNGVPRYIGTDGMRGIAKYLAHTLDVRTSTRVTSLQWLGKRWGVMTEAGTLYESDIVGLTAPVPQSLELLKYSLLPLPCNVAERLEKIYYQPCIAMLVLLKQPSQIPEPGGMWLSGGPIAWISDNWKKGISSEGYAVTIHTGSEFSQQQWDESDDAVAEKIIQASAPWLGGDVARYHIHRWRYSQAVQGFGEPYAYFEEPGPLFLFGDAFGGNRVEGAFLSGHSAADQIVTHF